MLATALALAAICAVVARAGMLMRENLELLARSRAESLTDALTGLGNRRALMVDLEEALMQDADSPARRLLLFDLDGFKKYNDTFGHLAGDQLLHRLGRALSEATAGLGRAYRLGGDEFCVVVHPQGNNELVDAHLVGALFEQGDGFVVSASHGTVELPGEAYTTSEVLHLADERMYQRKNRRSGRTEAQTRETLVRVIHARNSTLADELAQTAGLARAVAVELGLPPEDVNTIVNAAELVDLGKLAIPDAILLKPGQLTEDEWAFMRRSPQISARILAPAPALRPLVPIVRSAHEHLDGTGYPDGLAADDIPVAARVIGACRAYVAMTSERPYRAAMSPEQAVEQLRRAAGRRYDSAIVSAVEAVRQADALPAGGYRHPV
jgi:diguanylate cyclase (GGDEF)-like protein